MSVVGRNRLRRSKKRASAIARTADIAKPASLFCFVPDSELRKLTCGVYRPSWPRATVNVAYCALSATASFMSMCETVPIRELIFSAFGIKNEKDLARDNRFAGHWVFGFRRGSCGQGALFRAVIGLELDGILWRRARGRRLGHH